MTSQQAYYLKKYVPTLIIIIAAVFCFFYFKIDLLSLVVGAVLGAALAWYFLIKRKITTDLPTTLG